MKPTYDIVISDDIVYIEEHVHLNGHKVTNSFQFELHVFNRSIGIDVLLSSTAIEDDDNFTTLLDEHREY